MPIAVLYAAIAVEVAGVWERCDGSYREDCGGDWWAEIKGELLPPC